MTQLILQDCKAAEKRVLSDLLVVLPALVLLAALEVVLEAFFAVRVVLLAQLGILEDLKGSVDAHKLGVCVGLVGVLVGMLLQRKLLEGAANVLRETWSQSSENTDTCR